MSDTDQVERLHTNDMELGATEAVQRHISRFTAQSIAAGEGTVYNSGSASNLCAFRRRIRLHRIVIWAALDPANPFVSPFSAPFVIGLAYTNTIRGFTGISTNLACDIRTCLVAVGWFGGEAFSYKNYSWTAILVNIPATLFATVYYKMLSRDG
ncbi:hypothetical protein K469DRAFT_744105 [Zopfia rhizophila CBS 207.26]|uniref:Uncharacterized protein n=1 Tax=Zopfia rhizophila CBS 207.26 TaxID=1314779 RepID=A0A6A6F053_9PEZI|nr:hypothetical protein K469DRAFT_744105 [Zopfia rhizophila CBS 207.26]